MTSNSSDANSISGNGSNPGSSNPSGSNPSDSNPSDSNPADSNPGASNPSGSNPSGYNPGGSNPGGSNPSGSNPGASNGPAPSLEAYVNYKPIAPPTLLRSEKRQAGENEYVKGCSKLEEILEQALGLSQTIPVAPATIITGLRDMHQQCKKRKRDVTEGKPIPPKDLIDLTQDSDDSEPPPPNQQTSPTKKKKRAPNAKQQPSDAPKEPISQPVSTNNVPNVDKDSNSPSHNNPQPSQSSVNEPSTVNNKPPATFSPMIVCVPPTKATQATDQVPPTSSTANTSNPPGNQPLTIIKDESVRIKIHEILRSFHGNLSRPKFKLAHLSIHSFIDCRAQSYHKRTPPAELPQFTLVQSEASHSVWLKEIQKYLELILLPSDNEPWYSPQLLDIPKLNEFKATDLKINNEYPLILFLAEIQKPAKIHLTQWSNCIASSIQLTAQDFAFKQPSLGNLTDDTLGSHLQILQYLNRCKTNSTGSGEDETKMCNDMTLKPLYQLHDSIIDMFITYSIIRWSAAADVEADGTSAESQALVVQKKELETYRSRHNSTPFCLYLVAGICGLILATSDCRFASGANALAFLTAVEHIFKTNQPQRTGLEPVWKRLGAYVDSLFIESFLTPNCLFNFRPPQIIQLAQAITSDFLICLQSKYPAKQFQLPCALTAKV